jgi:hypothetical protein
VGGHGRFLGIAVSPSLPGLTRQSSFLLKMMDARVEPGHDERKKAPRSANAPREDWQAGRGGRLPTFRAGQYSKKAANRDLTTPAIPGPMRHAVKTIMNSHPFNTLSAEQRENVRAALATAFGSAKVDAIVPISGGASTASTFRLDIRGKAYLLRVEGKPSPLRNPHQYVSMLHRAATAQ